MEPSKWRKLDRRDFANLRTPEGAVQFETKLKAKFKGNQPSWDELAEALTATAHECCGVTLLPNKPWIDAECWKVIEERRHKQRRNVYKENGIENFARK